MLTVRLATTPDYLGSGRPSPQSQRTVEVRFEVLPQFSSRGRGTPVGAFRFPAPGAVMADAIAPPSNAILRVQLRCGPDMSSFVVGPLGDGDVLTITGGEAPPIGGKPSRRSMYAAGVIHVDPQDSNPCQVRCDDDSLLTDDCCIECSRGQTTVKFCC